MSPRLVVHYTVEVSAEHLRFPRLLRFPTGAPHPQTGLLYRALWDGLPGARTLHCYESDYALIQMDLRSIRPVIRLPVYRWLQTNTCAAFRAGAILLRNPERTLIDEWGDEAGPVSILHVDLMGEITFADMADADAFERTWG